MASRKYPNINSLWGTFIVEELIRNGVDYFCISPGSRSAPLTAAIALNKKAKSIVHFDERGTAFHALGFASATHRPVALICTSGTAGANFYPAIIEASKKKIPLIVLTADRPPELLKSGADQAIEQSGLFGKFTKWQFDLPCPTEEIKPEFVLTTIDQAVFQSKNMMPGPVHLNFMFREPLAPVGKLKNFDQYLNSLVSWQKTGQPFTRYHTAKPQNTTFDPSIITTLNTIKNGIIVVGKLPAETDPKDIVRLSRLLQWPIFPDITSGLRLGVKEQSEIITNYHLVLTNEKIVRKLNVDGILHLGGRMSPKRYYQFIEALKPKHYISVLAHPLRNDPLHAVTCRIQSPVLDFCLFASKAIQKRQLSKQFSYLMKTNAAMERDVERLSLKSNTLSEISVARLISKNAPKDSALFLASSMPIREMDTFASGLGNSLLIGSNRGASGIDGTIASAIGFAKGSGKATTLFIGDLAFLHDLNSLAMIRDLSVPFVVVVINNNGGGIFNFLPISNRQDIFEKYFATPHRLTFSPIAEQFGLKYKFLRNSKNFVQSYRHAVTSRQATILEIKTNRNENVAAHLKIFKTLRKRSQP